jgi:hypothetical protein
MYCQNSERLSLPEYYLDKYACISLPPAFHTHSLNDGAASRYVSAGKNAVKRGHEFVVYY